MNNVFMENIGALTEAVTNFQHLEEETEMNDPVIAYNKEKENYEHEIEKLLARIKKQTEQGNELATVAAAVTEELSVLDDEKNQYQEQFDLVTAEAAQYEA